MGHTIAAANIIRSTQALGNATTYMIGLAPGASVDAASIDLFNLQLQQMSSQKKYDIVSIIYDPRLEPCVTEQGGSRGDVRPNLHRNVNQFYTVTSRNTSTLFIVAATQPDNGCKYVNNNSEDLHLDHKRTKRDYAGAENLDIVQKVPAYYYLSGDYDSANDASDCNGFHCIERARTILVGALTMDGRPRKDTRMSYSRKILFAPGTNILTGNSARGFGAECGTSFASPVVAAISAQVLSQHHDRIRPGDIKGWLAATAEISEKLTPYVEAGMSYGGVNFQRAIESDPDNFTIWRFGVEQPLIAREIRVEWGNRVLTLDEVRQAYAPIAAGEKWQHALSLIARKPRRNNDPTPFYFISVINDEPVAKRFELAEPGDAGMMWAKCDGDEPDDERCLAVTPLGGGPEQRIPYSEITHLIFPKRFWGQDG
jgi:hypothetical protein